jgi:hypothetical protein
MPPRRAARLGLMLSLLLPPGLAGCGPTEAERRMAGMAEGMAQAVARQRDCRAAAFDRPDRAEFARRMPMVAEHATPAQLADRARVRPGQRAALASFFADLAECRAEVAGRARAALPELGPLLEESEAAGERNRARLLAGEIPWGEANAQAMALAAEFRGRAGAVAQAVHARLEAEHEAEMRPREAAAAIAGVALAVALVAATGHVHYVGRVGPVLIWTNPHPPR